MHVRLVFVTRYRRQIFDHDATEKRRTYFSNVCADFEAKLVEMDGEPDHVHLLINYPPKLAIFSLVNSLKGISNRLLRRDRPDIAVRYYYKGVMWSPGYFASSCGGAPISVIRQYIEQQQTPGQVENRALYPRPAVLAILPVAAEVRQYPSSANTLNNSKHLVRWKTAPYIPALKDGVLRRTG